MSPEEFASLMRKCFEPAKGDFGYIDRERAHEAADEVMLALLRELGYSEGADIFEKADKWYA